MSKTEYKLRLFSKQNNTIDSLYEVLNTNTFSKVLFPAWINQNPDQIASESVERIKINCSSEFNTSYIPSVFIEENKIALYLYSENGIKSWCDFKYEYRGNFSMVVIDFNQIHTTIMNPMNNIALKNIIVEVFNKFKLFKADVVYDLSNQKENKWKIKRATFDIDNIIPQWITYLGKEICDFVGRQYLLTIDGCSEIREIGGGILFEFMQGPFDSENSEHIKHQAYLLEQFRAIPLPPPEV